MLFQIDGDVESLSTIADLLSSASPDSWFGLNHSLLGNTKQRPRDRKYPPVLSISLNAYEGLRSDVPIQKQ
jgi:hypothetical protein